MDFSSWKVADLKKELSRRGLATNVQLIARLEESDKQGDAQNVENTADSRKKRKADELSSAESEDASSGAQPQGKRTKTTESDADSAPHVEAEPATRPAETFDTDIATATYENGDNVAAKQSKNRYQMLLHLVRHSVTTAGMKHVVEWLHDTTAKSPLQILALVDTQISREAFKMLMEAVKTTNSVRRVGLAQCAYKRETLRFLTDAFKVNRSVQELQLSSRWRPTEALETVCEILPLPGIALKLLVIENSQITDENLSKLLEALKINESLEHINLASNQITGAGATRLCEVIKLHPRLKEVRLSGNPIGPEGFAAFAGILRDTTRFEVLYLDNCGGKTEGLIAVAEALAHNNTLVTLSVRGFAGTDAGLKLFEALKTNRTLKRLGLRAASLSDACANCLVQVLRENSALEVIELGDNGFTDRGVTKIVEAMQDNTKVRIGIENNAATPKEKSRLAKLVKPDRLSF